MSSDNNAPTAAGEGISAAVVGASSFSQQSSDSSFQSLSSQGKILHFISALLQKLQGLICNCI